LSTLPNQVDLGNSWKDEVNQRLAAHKSRKSLVQTDCGGAQEPRRSTSSRAAAAAARVAARYANEPSYSESRGEVVGASVRAAETKAAQEPGRTDVGSGIEESALPESAMTESTFLDAPGWEAYQTAAMSADWATQAAGESVVAGSESAEWMAESVRSEAQERERFDTGGEPNLAGRAAAEPAVSARNRANSNDTSSNKDANYTEREMGARRKRARKARETTRDAAEEAVSRAASETADTAQPIHANLIQFPRELVATRKVRPRRAEGPYAEMTEQGGQLSIFEVDPGAFTMEAAQTSVLEEAAAPAWKGPEWSGIKLDAQPECATQTAATEMLEDLPEPVFLAPDVELAPLSRRAMAAVVNGSLIVGAYLASALVAASNMKVLPGLKQLEVGTAIGVMAAGVLYMTLSYVLGNGTPGMRYAGLSLCTFDGQSPTREQRCVRLVALVLSVLPAGLGVLWAIFDEDHLSWHDRLSATYLRRS
jgi:uncharacterized RDD family membrane protein YckC